MQEPTYKKGDENGRVKASSSLVPRVLSLSNNWVVLASPPGR